MYRHKLFALLIGVALVHGCNVNEPSDNNDGRDNPSDVNVPGLKAFQSESDLHNYMMGQVETRGGTVRALEQDNGNVGENESADAAPSAGGAGFGDAGGPTAAPSAPSDGDLQAVGGDDHSGTTIQEAGVDEADVVKTDGEYLYILRENKLKIVQVSNLAVLSDTSLNGWGRDLYLHGDKVVALTESWGGELDAGGGVAVPPIAVDTPVVDVDVEGGGSSGSEGMSVDPATGVGISRPEGEVTDAGLTIVDPTLPDGGIVIDFAPTYYYRPRTALDIIDVADRATPRVIGHYEFDGWQASSRMIDGVLRLVVANYQYYFYDVVPMMGREGADFSSVDATLLIPKYDYIDANGNKTSGDVVNWNELFRPDEADGFGVMALISLDVDDSSRFTSVGLVAEPGLIYSSTDALYVTNTEYDYLGDYRSSTNIYKFEYTADGATPTATGSIPGRILNQYSMSEHNGHLRVATTSDPVWSETGVVERSTNNVFVLSATGTELSVVGRIENIAPGETIQAARFLGDRGYLVTFEQVDPLFTLDLATPTAPTIVGELKVPGFSTFIVPIDQDHLLTVGNYIPEQSDDSEIAWRPWGVQLSIFDVTDFANPTLAHSVVLGEEWGAWSEAMWNPKAFTYYAEEGLLALPVSIQEEPDYQYTDPFGGLIDFDNVNADGDLEFDVVIDLDENGEPVDVIIDGQSAQEIAASYVPPGFDGLIVYEVSGENGFTEKGRISTRFSEQQFYYPSYTRGVFIGDNVYAVTDGGVRSAAISDVGTVTSEMYYGYIPEPWNGDIWGGGGFDDGGISMPGEPQPEIDVRR